jgi:hypothetical protein
MAATIYERRLSEQSDWALREGSMHFEEKSAVHTSLHAIVRKLDELGIPYAVAGGMALFSHGFRRFTEDVDLLVDANGLVLLHEKLEGLGYVPPFTGSKHLRDTATGVRIEFLVAGQFPGDGKPKPVAFPDPATAYVEIDGIRYLKLPVLVELKLASGMTNPGRLKDISDVQELIRVLKLPSDFGAQLNEYVRPTFAQLWETVQQYKSSEPE